VLCKRGEHASERPIDALKYASGAIVSRVVLSGTIVLDTDKAVATKRYHEAVFDASDLLHRFAVWCVGMALTAEREAGREPDARSWAALDAKMGWLSGNVSDKELEAASEAAYEAASEAARWAANEAASEAARWAANWAASWAARRAASEAAYEAARWAVSNEQNRILENALLYVIEAKEAMA